ncbi:succinate dehydrogenase/fumarate reductase iron-sulfur subunit [Schwartzia succinivorans]|jgi:succinate dehydrogenase / fumarate reductase iron-sulfur subunit|uniref:Fumarate reductase iron-sulfur subunit n=1 Tax=Schwartzia succinivorans DSM 10502 TaxID=1123243 RepID=A0A1M4WCC9_9FIRM|nr:succinate dehydrogenase/fumarate reductase iron-sulfur subunit [Schwartzia succinivorans]MBQ1918877.1 succinate dehydrogenase/fumarate reductase iron-sulfur subunit [Schwartzia sp. (in: firmicutes)]MBE6096449.1 succinate dehydrogenase/fumarate reductase iron-sulfur subunit [Schwartzia succinivorans]MBQ3863908.1 succinate dehydrogenase/fumarate reductase iron-sulfur subunit [Schwartzia sp. (in: firmicutes)]MBQ4152379.1 succinate dehydrogenase/fumarate reductase iron-sulfur subunit [Schwartzia
MDMNLKIHRFVEGKKWVQDYKLTVKTGMTVLEALTEVKEKQDPTLSFTCSCRSSICGACAVRVNGNAELSCEVLVETLMKRYKTDTLVIEPLGNFKVIRDLVVDWDPKYATIKKIKPVIEPKKEFSLETGCKQSPEEFNKFKKYAKCILCGSCVSECNKSALNQEDFLSPFVFVKAERLVADSRNRSPQEQLKAIVEAGLWRCFNCQECTAKCPKGLDPAGAIEKLKESTFAHKLDDNVGARHAKAIYDDISDSGTLDESKLNIKSEGLIMAALRAPMAVRLMRTGKMNPMNGHPVNPEIETIRKIVKNAEAASKEAE